MDTDTIFAPASGPGPAGVAIIRISGKDAAAALTALTRRPPPPPRRATRARIIDAGGEILDEALVLWFPAPASYSGEDVAEIHLHGGRAVIAGVLEALAACPGLRPAEPGEFTRRAFDNGKLDLTAAEGLADLIAAETAAQRRLALGQLQGVLAALYDGWRRRLIEASAYLEATIDFSDEDLPEGLGAGVSERVRALVAEIEHHLQDGHRGERLRAGILVAIIGPPNAGKSSILNRLAGREAAIVSHHPGTTRDVIEVAMDLGGYPVTVADTAGLRDSTDEIELEGVKRARGKAREADLRLVVLDGALWPAVDHHTVALIDDDTLIIANKRDLGRLPTAIEVGGRPALCVSALTGEGIDAMVDALEGLVAGRYHLSATPTLTRVRHRRALEDCVEHLRRSLAADQAELTAEDLRLAARALGRITGRVDVEELLDVVFRDFCIGK